MRLREAAFVGVSGGIVGAAAAFASLSTAVLVALVPAILGLALIVAQRVAPEERRLYSARLLAWVGLLAPTAISIERNVADTRASPVSGANVVQAIVSLVCVFLIVTVCRVRWRPANGTEWLLFGFVGWAALSSFWSIQPLASVLKAGELLVALVLIGLLVRSVPPNQDAALRHLVGAFAVLAFMVLAGAILAPGVAFLPAEATGSAVRLSGVFPYIHPDGLGLLSCYGVMAAIAGVWPQWCSKRSTRVLVGCLFLAELLLSRTRSSLALVAVGVIVLALADRSRRLKLFTLLAGLLLLAFAVAPLATGPVQDFLQRDQSAENIANLSGRTENWQQALDESAGHRIGGLGFYAGHRFNEANLNYFNESGLSNLDNTYVEAVVDVGFVGFSLLVLALVAGLRRVLLAARSTTWALRVAMFTIGVVSAFLSPSLQTPGTAMIVLAFVMMMPNARSLQTDVSGLQSAEHPRHVREASQFD